MGEEGDSIPVIPQVAPQVRELILCIGHGELGAAALMKELGLSDRENFRERYLRPALDVGCMEMTMPGKPRSSRQAYRLTSSGAAVLAGLG